MIGEYQLDEVLEEYSRFSSSIKSAVWTEQKPWAEFFAVFKTPQWNVKNIEQRLTTNYDYYWSNYVSICAGIIALQILFAPIVFLVVVISVCMCVYVIIIRKKPIVIGNIEVTTQMKSYGCAGTTFLVMALSGVMVKLIWVALYSALICFVHMLFRPRNVSSKTEKIYENLNSNVSGVGVSWDPENGGSYNSESSGRKQKSNASGGFIHIPDVLGGFGTTKKD